MSIVKKHLILHTFENVGCTGPYGFRDRYRTHWYYPSANPTESYYNTNMKPQKMLFEKETYSTIIYIEWVKDKRNTKKRFNLFK